MILEGRRKLVSPKLRLLENTQWFARAERKKSWQKANNREMWASATLDGTLLTGPQSQEANKQICGPTLVPNPNSFGKKSR
jgi:hypothetical protein